MSVRSAERISVNAGALLNITGPTPAKSHVSVGPGKSFSQLSHLLLPSKDSRRRPLSAWSVEKTSDVTGDLDIIESTQSSNHFTVKHLCSKYLVEIFLKGRNIYSQDI